jgi:hypothetical protein
MLYSALWGSWEPAENVEQCDRLLRSFWKHVGMDNDDYTPGDQFDAEDWWIGVYEYSIFDYIMLITKRQHGSESISPTCGVTKTRKRKRHQKTDTTPLRSGTFHRI